MKQTATLSHANGSQTSAAHSMLAAMLIIGITDNAVPLMAEQIGLGQFYLMRTFVALPFLWLMARAGLGGLAPRRFGAVLVRAVLVAVLHGILLFRSGADADCSGAGGAVHLAHPDRLSFPSSF